jgi:hypothetical protein
MSAALAMHLSQHSPASANRRTAWLLVARTMSSTFNILQRSAFRKKLPAFFSQERSCYVTQTVWCVGLTLSIDSGRFVKMFRIVNLSEISKCLSLVKGGSRVFKEGKPPHPPPPANLPLARFEILNML